LTQATLGAEDIFFEYGAESGVLQPPFDWVGIWSPLGTKIEFETTTIHGGQKSIKFTTDLSDAQAQGHTQTRAQLNWHGGLSQSITEAYISYWAYLPDAYDLSSQGWDIAFDFHWRVAGVAWYDLPKVYIKKSTSYPPFVLLGSPQVGGVRSTTAIPRNQWVHFQMYYKLGVSDGIYRVWQDDALIFNYTNVDTATTSGGVADSIHSIEWKLYPSQYDPDSIVKYVDDFVVASEKVTETYKVEYPSLEFEEFEDGFETGDFSAWNGTQYANGGVQPTVTSTYAKYGTYSANFTTDGSDNSYARAMHIIQNTSEVFQRSYVRFEDLPDTDGTRILVLRIAQEDGTWIASAGINRTGGNYYWHISETGGTSNNTQDTIGADSWQNIEFHFNTTIGQLWINDTLKCEIRGDFSGVGNLARVYPYIYVIGTQISAKTVYHDNYQVDNVRIDDRTDPRIASRIDLTAEPNAVSRNYGLSQITVQLKDQDNQTVAQSGVAVTVEISSWSGLSTMKPVLFLAGQFGHLVTVTTDSDGLATIYTMAQDGAGTATLTASADELSSGNTVVHVT